MSTVEVLATTEEHTRELPLDPIWIGLITFAILLALLAGVLMFGKGRPHS
jgi:hypothetical protein